MASAEGAHQLEHSDGGQHDRSDDWCEIGIAAIDGQQEAHRQSGLREHGEPKIPPHHRRHGHSPCHQHRPEELSTEPPEDVHHTDDPERRQQPEIKVGSRYHEENGVQRRVRLRQGVEEPATLGREVHHRGAHGKCRK